jgi:chromosomal replication initiator protein
LWRLGDAFHYDFARAFETEPAWRKLDKAYAPSPRETSMNAWLQVLNYLKTKVNTQSYQTWLRPTRFSHIEGEALIVSVPNREFQEWIQDNYGSLVSEALSDLNLVFKEIRYTFAETAEEKRTSGDDPKELQRKLDFDSVDYQLDPKYTFDTFVVGSCNQFAHAAARAVAQAPAKAYNPLFLYGGVGLGKTHLMQAVGHAVKHNWKDMRLAYVSSETFTNDVINSLRYDRMVTFRDKYRSVDVLLIDDIEFIARKERTMEEFFHTFNALYQAQRQVVISADCAPKEIPGLEERLRSRFDWGLTADLQTPDLETKRAILAKKCEGQGLALPDEVSDFIARAIKSSVRELEGALNKLIAYSSLTGAEITLSMAQKVLKIDPGERRVPLENIQRAVCQEFGLTLPQLRSKNNSHPIAYPRQVAMYLAKELTKASLQEIGRDFGGKHHTTVLHSINKISRLRESDRDLHRLLNKLRDSLAST